MLDEKHDGLEPEELEETVEVVEESGATEAPPEELGESGQEPRTDEPLEGGEKQKSKGRIDLEALPEDVREAFEGLLKQLREKNREARRLRRRLRDLESAMNRREREGKEPTKAQEEAHERLNNESKEAEEKLRALERRLQEYARYAIQAAVMTKALQMGFRQDALDLVQMLIAERYGDEIWDAEQGKVDEEALEDYLQELAARKKFLLKSKPAQQKPSVVKEGAGKRVTKGPVIDEDELARRFGL